VLDPSFDLQELSKCGRPRTYCGHIGRICLRDGGAVCNRPCVSDPWKDASDTEAVVNAYFWRVGFY
jgi:hypothetical protein